MTVLHLINTLRKLPEYAQLVIQTQRRHSIYGDIADIEEWEDDGEATKEDIKEQIPKNMIYIISVTNEGYSPNQAIEKRW